MPYTNISAVLSAADKTAINNDFNDVKAKLPFGVNLTPDERQSFTKLGDARLAFVTKCMDYAAANAPLVPGYLSLPEAVKDFNLQADLRPIEALAAQVKEIIDDTRLAAGHELYDFCLAFYNAVQDAAKRNVPGTTSIFDDLKQLFADQGGPGTPTTPIVP